MTAPGCGGADEIREQLAEEVSGWPLGGGYYQYTIGTDEAREIADALLPTVQALIAKGAADAREQAVKRVEAAEAAEESLRERVARAMCAFDAFGDGTAWDESEWLRKAYRGMAVAAIAVMRGPR